MVAQKRVKKSLKQKKSLGYDYIGRNHKLLQILEITIIGSLALANLVSPLLPFFSIDPDSTIGNVIAMSIGLIPSFAVGLIRSGRKYAEIEYYSPDHTHFFAGLFSSENIPKKSKAYILKRNHEIEYLNSVLRQIYEQPKEQPKRSRFMCLTGESGSGKSTIKRMFLDQIDPSITFIDYSEDYNDLEHKLTVADKLSAESIGDLIVKLGTHKGKLLLVFDQFENYFLLPKETQDTINRDFFSKITMPNVVVLFVMREDLFSKYYAAISISTADNNQPHSGSPIANRDSESVKSGILRERISEPPATFLFCVDHDSGNSAMKKFCMKAFKKGKNKQIGYALYEKFKDSKLIEQQIIFNKLETDKSLQSVEDVELLDKDEILTDYYDHQLASFKDYKTAVKIMYLLSISRPSNTAYAKEDLVIAVCDPPSKVESDVEDCIQHLLKLNLISPSTREHDSYEIVHDYIAETFTEYGKNELDSDTQNALNNFRLSFKNKARYEHIRQAVQQYQNCPGIYNAFLYSSIVLSLVGILRLSLTDDNLYYLFAIIPCILVNYYGFAMFTNILRYAKGKKPELFILCVAGFWLTNACTVIFSHYWLAIQGLCITWIGVTLLLIAFTNDLYRNSKKFFRDFGVKVICSGGGIAIAGILATTIFKAYFSDYSFWGVSTAGTVIMCCFMIYAYLAQLNDTYYFSCIGKLNNKRFS